LEKVPELGKNLKVKREMDPDHPWGNHYLLLEGPLKRWNLMGELPRLNLSSDDDMDHKGKAYSRISMTSILTPTVFKMALEMEMMKEPPIIS